MNFNFSNLSYLSNASLLINLEESKLLEEEEPSFLRGLFWVPYVCKRNSPKEDNSCLKTGLKMCSEELYLALETLFTAAWKECNKQWHFEALQFT